MTLPALFSSRIAEGFNVVQVCVPTGNPHNFQHACPQGTSRIQLLAANPDTCFPPEWSLSLSRPCLPNVRCTLCEMWRERGHLHSFLTQNHASPSNCSHLKHCPPLSVGFHSLLAGCEACSTACVHWPLFCSYPGHPGFDMKSCPGGIVPALLDTASSIDKNCAKPLEPRE